MLRCLPLLCLFLGACIRDEVLVTQDAWTHAVHITVQEREIYRDADAVVVARPAAVIRDGHAGFAVLTNVRRKDADGPRIEKMTSFGHALQYQRHDRLRTHCVDGCQSAEVGAIQLSRATFVTAARTGLPLKIWGLRGRYQGTIPAEAFAKVLAQFE